MFFESNRGARYAVAQIVKIGRAASTGEHTITLTNGDQTSISPAEYQRLLQFGTIVPAPLGTFILYANGPDKADMGRSPVLAWMLGSDGAVRPITMDGVNDGMSDESLAILTPDGSVSRPHDCTWDSVEEFLKAQPATAEPQS